MSGTSRFSPATAPRTGAAHAFRIDAVPVADLKEPITLAVPLGESAKSVDALLAVEKGAATARVSGEELQELILELLATGETSPAFIDHAAKDKLAANSDTVYKSGLEPLRKGGRIKAHKARLNDGWYWQLSEADA